MQFLPDVYVPCEVCKGKRYNRETLEVKFKGKSIADVLEMTVEEALRILRRHPADQNKLQTLYEVGLGYIHLGQPATTLSGGEAQRVKLATELSRARDRQDDLHPGRADDGSAFRGCGEAASGADPAGGHRQHHRGDRAQPGRHQDGGLDHRSGARGRRCWRLDRGDRDARGDRGISWHRTRAQFLRPLLAASTRLSAACRSETERLSTSSSTTPRA